MPRTVWISSYPKSGNTWFRLVLEALLEGRSTGSQRGYRLESIASSRALFDRYLGAPSALLTASETCSLYPAANQLANDHADAQVLLRKIHDAYGYLDDGTPLFGDERGFSAVYILRNPWDVAVSAAHFYGCDYAESVRRLLDPDHKIAISDTKLAMQLPQWLSSWEKHALSWLQAPINVHLMRYEDMHKSALTVFSGALSWMGLRCDENQLNSAIEHCRFENLQRREQQQGFDEKPLKVAQFFRRGVVGEGLEVLAPEQIDQLAAANERVEAAIKQRGLA